MTLEQKLGTMRYSDWIYLAFGNLPGYAYIGPVGEFLDTPVFRPADACEVTEEWRHREDRPGLSLRVDYGGRSGKFWFRSEYLAGRKEMSQEGYYA